MAPTEQIEAFFAKRPLKKYAKGEVVVFPNGTVPPISLLVKGQVGQYHITDDGIKMLLTIFKPGAYFPMSAAINCTPSPHFFEALTPVEVRQAPSRDIAEFVKDKPDILLDLLSRLYRGIDGLLGRMAHSMVGNARQRLLYELYISARRFGVPGTDGAYLVKITEQQLAQQTGLARETVSRELQRSKVDGTAWTSKDGLRVMLPRIEDELGLQ